MRGIKNMYKVKIYKIDLTKNTDIVVMTKKYKTKQIALNIVRRYNTLFNNSHNIAILSKRRVRDHV